MENRIKKHSGQSGCDGNISLRTKRIWLTVSPNELDVIFNFFQLSSQTTFAHFCRNKLLSKSVAIQNNNKIISAISMSLYSQNKIGNNINQIAKKIHGTGTVYKELIDELSNELNELKLLKLNLFKNLNLDHK